ncbi:MAG: Hsp20/alpha crystallin family protein [Steroidobacteraceae bacterium]
MSIAQYEPWSLFNRLSRDFSHVVATPGKVTYTPPVDVREEADRFVVQADLPGVELADIEITADKGVLTLRGERKAEKREKSEGYERVERVTGNFSRRFALPENVQSDDIKARFTNGVLEVTIPKQPVQQARRVSIETH